MTLQGPVRFAMLIFNALAVSSLREWFSVLSVTTGIISKFQTVPVILAATIISFKMLGIIAVATAIPSVVTATAPPTLLVLIAADQITCFSIQLEDTASRLAHPTDMCLVEQSAKLAIARV